METMCRAVSDSKRLTRAYFSLVKRPEQPHHDKFRQPGNPFVVRMLEVDEEVYCRDNDEGGEYRTRCNEHRVDHPKLRPGGLWLLQLELKIVFEKIEPRDAALQVL